MELAGLEPILFAGLALVAAVSGLLVIVQRHAVYSAMYLIITMGSLAGLYVLLGAHFVWAVQVLVYAGAIMVLFLFVIMLLGAEQTGRTPSRWWYQPVSLFLGVVLLVEIAIILFSQSGVGSASVEVPSTFGSPLAIGELLFTRYLLPFEATSILLLAAMVGAIVMTRGEKK